MPHDWTVHAIVIAVSLLTTAVAVVLHYHVLVQLGAGLARRRRRADNALSGHRLFLKVFAALFALHTVQIVLFGVAFWQLMLHLPAGGVTGAPDAVLPDAIYLSSITFTTVGFGDVAPTGPIRLLAGMESLVGFMLITWSASFAFINMERHWRAVVENEADEDEAEEARRRGSRASEDVVDRRGSTD